MYCATPDGKHHGPYVEWASEEDSAEGAEHGVMRASGAYKWDRRQGQFKRWFEDGRLESEGEYNDDLQEGYWRIWSRSSAHEYGSYSKGKREGKWVESDRTSRFEGTYKDGKREGVWIEYLSGGDKFKESQYVDGLLDGTETRKWPSGQKCVETYVRGLLEGLSVCHHPNGRKMSEATFSNNRLVGRQSWDERGRPE
jgi:antitoxin component YwqK of YwqJK toxin-antitoxin module